MRERVPKSLPQKESGHENDPTEEDRHLVGESREIQKEAFGEAILQESLKWVQKLQAEKFQKDNHKRYQKGVRWEHDGIVDKEIEEALADSKTEELNEGLETLTTVIGQMNKAISRGAITTENLSKSRKLAEEYQRLSGKDYNKGVVLGTLTDWIDKFQQKGTKPSDVDLRTVRYISESVENMMYKIHQYGDVSQANRT